MANRNWNNSAGDGALLGMIVDRSSFDDDELSRSQSFDEESVRRKNGRVRRKLKWKPPGLSRRRKPSSSSNESVRSGKTKASFHTFHSTETPVQSNKKTAVRQHTVMPRPNYPDTFEGVATIDNEASLVHSRMAHPDSPVKLNRLSRSHTMPSRYDDVSGFDLESIQSDDYDPYGSDNATKPVMFDPFGVIPPPAEKKLSKRSRSRSGGTRSTMKRPPVPRPSRPPRPKTPVSPAGNRVHVEEVEEDTSMEENFPILAGDDIESDRRVDFFSSSEMSSVNSLSGADAAAGFGVSPLRTRRAASPVATTKPPHMMQQVTPERAPVSPIAMLAPPRISPRNSPRNSPVMVLSHDPIQAKVDLDLDSPRSLKNMIQSSGLLSKLRGSADYPLDSPMRRTTNRAVDPAASPISITSRSSPARYSEDDTMSTKSSAEASNEVRRINEGVEQVAYGRDAPRTPSPSSHRSKTGPVDVDEGQFLEAERNLKAIHQMATEHLAHGEYEEALEVFEEILRGQRERYGPGHYRVGTALHNIGIVYLKSQQYKRAIAVCKEAVQVRKDALVPNHPDVAVSLAQLGVAHLECQQNRQALIAFQEALKIRREFLGPKHPKVGKILNNIGCALYELEEMEGAKLAFEEALEIQREALRTTPTASAEDTASSSNQALLSIVSTLCNIGSIKLRWGHFEEASVALEEALLIQQSVLGDDHPAVLTTIESINYVDSAMEGGGKPLPKRQVFGLWGEDTTMPVFPSTPEEAAMQCGADQPDKLANLKGIMSFGLNRSKRLYQKVEDILVPATSEVCGPIDGEDLMSAGSSVVTYERRRRRRAEV